MSPFAGLRNFEAVGRRAMTLATATTALALVPGVALADTTTQGESLAMASSGSGAVITDSLASGGKALKIHSNGSASGSASPVDKIAKVVVRARGQQCGGAPKMDVSIDGTRRISASVSATSYATYSADVALAAGKHTIKVAFTNDYRTSSCDRNLIVDNVVLKSAATTTTTEPVLSGTGTVSPTPTPTATATPVPTATPAPAPTGTVVFNGDHETGSLGQWSSIQRIAADRLAINTSEVRQGRYSSRYEIRGGDALLHTGQRSELLWGSDNNLTLRSGQEYYFGWSTKFANDFPSPTNGGHCLFVQWKNAGTGSPPLDMHCTNNRIQLNYSPKCSGWNTPLVRGGWNDFVARIKFSADPSVGFIELWHKSPNDASMIKKIARCNVATLKSGLNSYLKLGYYRRNDEMRTGVIFHDGMKVGTSYSAVAPA